MWKPKWVNQPSNTSRMPRKLIQKQKILNMKNLKSNLTWKATCSPMKKLVFFSPCDPEQQNALKAIFDICMEEKWTVCSLQCWDQDEVPPEDSQQHLLCCPKVKVDSSNITCNIITYEDIFGNVKRQKEAITLFTHLLEIKNKEINKQSPPGEKLDLSTS